MASRVLQHIPQEDQGANRTLAFLQEILREYHPRNFAVELWYGTCWEPEPGQFRRFGWKIHHGGAVRAVFGSLTQLGFAEAFIYGDFDLDGDLEGLFPLLEYLLNKNWSDKQKARLETLLAALPGGGDLRPVRRGPRLPGRVHSRERDRAAVEHHYGLSNDFYSLWLDKEMNYSCAYFHAASDNLESAQRQKLDYVCRKLRLRPGERFLDIGCGWGGLIIHAAREYGVNAVGVTLSEQEHRLAESRIQQADLGGRCSVKLLDYRDISEREAYDKVASLELLAHVGADNVPEYFRQVFRCLLPGGVFLHQFAASRFSKHEDRFANAHALPDAELLPLDVIGEAAESSGFEVCDLENLRLHYALTLRHWARGLEAHAEQGRRLLDEVTYRIWKFYIALRAYEFSSGQLGLYQGLMVKRGAGGLPLTRADWYEKREPVKQEKIERDSDEWSP